MKKTLILTLLVVALIACDRTPRIETEQLTAVETTYLTDQKHDSLFLSFEFEYPTQLSDKEVLKTIQTDLTKQFFGDAYQNMPIKEAMAEYIKMSIDEYKANNIAYIEFNEDEEEFSPVLSEEQIMTGRIMYLSNDVMSYQLEQYVYMGGVHGVNSTIYINYSLADGRQLEEKDLLSESTIAELHDMMLDAMIYQNEVYRSVDELTNAGYDISAIQPNGNFYLSDDGITWVFSPYEIAPYAFGETEIFIDNETLKKADK